MIVVKNVPGLTVSELITTLRAVRDPDERPPRTGDGGVVVGERTAWAWLSVYLPSTEPLFPPPLDPPEGPAPAPTSTPVVVAAPIAPPPEPVIPEPEPQVDAQDRPSPPRPRKRPTRTTPTRSSTAGGRHGGDL